MAATPAALPNVQHCCKNGRCFLYFFELFQAPLQQLWKITRYWTKTYKDSITAYGFVKIFIHGYHNIWHSKNDNLSQQTKKHQQHLISIYTTWKDGLPSPLPCMSWFIIGPFTNHHRTWEWRGDRHRSFYAKPVYLPSCQDQGNKPWGKKIPRETRCVCFPTRGRLARHQKDLQKTGYVIRLCSYVVLVPSFVTICRAKQC